MINITKDECMYLESKGLRWGEHLHHTYGKHHKYYATGASKVMPLLEEYRKSKTILVKEGK